MSSLVSLFNRLQYVISQFLAAVSHSQIRGLADQQIHGASDQNAQWQLPLERNLSNKSRRYSKTSNRAAMSVESRWKVKISFFGYLQPLMGTEGIPDEPVTLTPIRIFFVSVGFAKWLSVKLNKPLDQLRISIGRDPRITGADRRLLFTIQEIDLVQGGIVKASVTAGLASKGVEVTDFGLASTPAMFMSCITDGYNFDGALMLTASHLPFNRNGIKFFEAKGGLDKPDIKEILRLAVEECTQSDTDISKTTLVSFQGED